MPDEKTGEKHIADVLTVNGLVIDFQHSHINPKERESYEKFYRNMVWVVDGTRLKRDYPRFFKGQKRFLHFKEPQLKGFSLVDFPDEVFPADWIESSVPVIFDFRGIISSIEPQDAVKNTLWCLLPKRADRYALVVCLGREDFITTTKIRNQLLPVDEYIQLFTDLLRPKQRLQVKVKRRESQYILERGHWKKRKRFY